MVGAPSVSPLVRAPYLLLLREMIGRSGVLVKSPESSVRAGREGVAQGGGHDIPQPAGSSRGGEPSDVLVLEAILQNGQLTRAEISRLVGISKPTASQAINRLTNAGLVEAFGSEESRRPGRAGILYRLSPDLGFALAAALDRSGTVVRAISLDGTPVVEDRIGPAVDPTSTSMRLRNSVEHILHKLREKGRCLGAAVAIANPVDPVTGEVVPLLDTPFPEGVISVREALAGLIDTPVEVDNDANFAAIAEHHLGAARFVRDFVYIFIGIGIGMGLFLNGDLVRGHRGLVGEIGYLPIAVAKHQDTLSRQLLGRNASARHFITGAKDANDAVMTHVLQDIFAQGERGDPTALELIHEEAVAIGQAVAAVASVVDPELVIIGGPVGCHNLLVEQIQKIVMELAPLPIPVQAASIRKDPSLAGAAVRALRVAKSTLMHKLVGL